MIHLKNESSLNISRISCFIIVLFIFCNEIDIDIDEIIQSYVGNRIILSLVLSLHWLHFITALFTCSIYANDVN